jgi:hypothetical protein
MSDKLISLESALKEIRRFKGYIDDDMIERFSIAFKRLSPVELPMSAVEYLRAYARMHNSVYSCAVCPLSLCNNGTGYDCYNFECTHPAEAVAIVGKWAREHPERSEDDADV